MLKVHSLAESKREIPLAQSAQKITALIELPDTEETRFNRLVQNIMESNQTNSQKLSKIGEEIKKNQGMTAYAILSSAHQKLSLQMWDPNHH